MKRKIIKIDEDKCNGCGLCIPNCPEGALQVIEGKARLINDLFCDGLGACLGECPLGAISVEEREAEPYNEYKVMENVAKAGPAVIKAHLKHLKEHNEMEFFNQAISFLKENNMDIPQLEEKQEAKLPCGCPGTLAKDLSKVRTSQSSESSNVKLQPELRNWPIQLQLLNPRAPYLKNADLVIAADCTPFAYPDFHRRFLKNKVLIMFCPKLDTTLDQYVNKLSDIFASQDINSITIVHMEVPCCSGVENIIKQALNKSNQNIILKDYTISIDGEII